MPDKPKQPTVQVQQPPKQGTKTIESNDPVTNEAEQRIAQNELTGPDEERARAEQQAQEEEAKRQQELADQRRTTMQDILKSNEGFLVRDEDNADALEDARVQGLVHSYTVQSGPGGLDVEERYSVTDKGYSSLRSVFGENLGVRK